MSQTSRPAVSLYDVPQLRNGDLLLRAATADDAPRLGVLMRDVQTQLLTGAVRSPEDARRIAAGEEQTWLSDAELEELYDGWAVAEDRAVWVAEADGEVVGEVQLTDLDVPDRACEIRGWITGATDRGLGTRGLHLVLEHAFGTLGLHRIQCEVLADNLRALHVVRAAGFVLEGTFREAMLMDGRWVDAHRLAILESDPRG